MSPRLRSRNPRVEFFLRVGRHPYPRSNFPSPRPLQRWPSAQSPKSSSRGFDPKDFYHPYHSTQGLLQRVIFFSTNTTPSPLLMFPYDNSFRSKPEEDVEGKRSMSPNCVLDLTIIIINCSRNNYNRCHSKIKFIFPSIGVRQINSMLCCFSRRRYTSCASRIGDAPPSVDRPPC